MNGFLKITESTNISSSSIQKENLFFSTVTMTLAFFQQRAKYCQELFMLKLIISN